MTRPPRASQIAADLSLGLLLWGSSGCGPSPPPGPLELRVVGREYEWHVRYPGPDGRLDTPDDVLAKRDLHVPEDRLIEIDLASSDYIYGFRIPDLAVNQMAVPRVAFRASFRADEPGAHELKGDQMCGYAHEQLRGRVVVHTNRGFERWIREQRSSEQ